MRLAFITGSLKEISRRILEQKTELADLLSKKQVSGKVLNFII